jgi:uncharacterized membrane protein
VRASTRVDPKSRNAFEMEPSEAAETRPSTGTGGTPRPLWTNRTALTAIFAALAAALGFLLIGVPNVELLTFTVFAAGVVLGRLRGTLVGILGMALYSGANPYGSGAAIPTLFAAQLCSAAVAGFAGGAVSSLWRRPATQFPRSTMALVSALMGLSLTLLYQAAVIVGISAMSPDFRTGIVSVLVSNALFSLVHITSNTVIFAVLGPAVLPRLLRASLLSRRNRVAPGGAG